jgi:DNA-binding NarL/FixJ family response regulator
MRVVVADDSVLLREGLVRILAEGGFEVVGQAGTAEELLLKVRSNLPDIAITDIRMPPGHSDEGIRAARQIRARYPQVAVLVLSQYVELRYALDLLSDGADQRPRRPPPRARRADLPALQRQPIALRRSSRWRD